MDMTVILIIAALVAVGCAAAWYFQARARSSHLRERFGPEYERTQREVGDARRAEAALAAREKRIEKLQIRPLERAEADRFAEVWRHIQTLFVDDPKGATREADHLVNEVMTARGYPVADFNQRAADISVDHPRVVEHYRAARPIAERNQSGAAATEELRQALIHYRALFEDLLPKATPETPLHREVTT
jgi:hypothetical protein